MISVVGGVIRDDSGRILLAQRRGGDLDGLWEFPGGKIEAGESAHAALTRELHEELGIEVESSAALIRIPYRYPGKSIALEVRVVQAWSGQPRGREGQALRWMHEGELGTLPMPPADLPAVAALNLPQHIATSGTRKLSDATLMTTSPRIFEPGEQDAYDRLEQAAQLARYGCDCYAFCLLAAGHADIVIEAGLNSYDIAALIPLIENAGGIITTIEGKPADQGGHVIAAATPELHRAALERFNA